MNDMNRCMAALQLAGRLIMENGGETYRVEETITRMGRALGCDEVEIFAIPSGIFITCRSADGAVETSVKRVRRGETNLTRVDAVNAVSREMEQQGLSCDEVMQRLQAIRNAPPPVGLRGMQLAAGLSSAGWAVMFGGGLADAAVSAVVGMLVYLLGRFLDRRGLRSLVSTLAGSFLAALLPMLLHHFTGWLTVDAAVAAVLMPMLPGLAMTNAVQDTMRGDMVSGMSSAASAVLTASLIAGGALMGSALFHLVTGGAL